VTHDEWGWSIVRCKRLCIAMSAVLLLLWIPTPAMAIELSRMRVLPSEALEPPPAQAAWAEVSLPDASLPDKAEGASGAAWYRTTFQGPTARQPRQPWAVYLPFLYEGGQVWLNGELVGEVPEGSEVLQVRWERPHLFALPPSLLRNGDNDLAIRAAATPARTMRHFPIVSVAPVAELSPRYDRRQFWARTMPQITAVVCLAMAAAVLYIWWRRRSEVLYGLFGLAAALWGVRTLTFVIESMPSVQWQLWRVVYLGATGGFVVVLALFAIRFAGLGTQWTRWAHRALPAYWLLGPVWLLIAGPESEAYVNRWWTGGLIPIGLATLAVLSWSVARQRTLESAILPAALLIAVAAGIHDYMVSWDVGLLRRVVPDWAGQRFFLLHHGANLLLACMGGLLAARFIHTVDSLENLNLTLESRVRDREQQLAANFERLAELQRQNAVAQERRSIMREIHDGLGSRLFTSLSRVERGDMDAAQIADALRQCIADMRLALDALAPDAPDFRAALGNFLFRWQQQLGDAGMQASWTIDVPDEAPTLTPQLSLQLLRIAQEALTNVLKHSNASSVRVQLHQAGEALELEIVDDGRGIAECCRSTGRGIENMRARARQLGAQLELQGGPNGTRVALLVPIADRPA
jgi:signal transduction histidine kinase